MGPRDFERLVAAMIPGPYPRTIAYLLVAVVVIAAVGLR